MDRKTLLTIFIIALLILPVTITAISITLPSIPGFKTVFTNGGTAILGYGKKFPDPDPIETA